jgi:Squalene/phytoene synthase
MVTLERIDEASTLVRRRDAGLAMSPAGETTIAQRIRNAGLSFVWSTRLLSAPRRKAMRALYLFCRELDDISDSEASRTLKTGGAISSSLGGWARNEKQRDLNVSTDFEASGGPKLSVGSRRGRNSAHQYRS